MFYINTIATLIWIITESMSILKFFADIIDLRKKIHDLNTEIAEIEELMSR